ncbi:MAG: deoxyribose-phosphate aldolase [Actinobacteria bacterium]|nr:MAG: deoxyribose-phosphate aldolase [Actinomycetota bacterium]
MDRDTLAAAIDQTMLKPTVGFAEGARWIEANAALGFAALCVAPFLVPVAAQKLAGTATKVCSVCGFPLGYANTESKAEEAAHLVELGCQEVDMVMNVAAFLEGEDGFVADDVAAVVAQVEHVSGGSALVKVIIETGHLDAAQIARAAVLVADSGAAFVKTCTGFGPRGATADDVRTLRAAVGERIGVKASGGIRDLVGALEMLDAGATRLGSSSGTEILDALAHGRG